MEFYHNASFLAFVKCRTRVPSVAFIDHYAMITAWLAAGYPSSRTRRYPRNQEFFSKPSLKVGCFSSCLRLRSSRKVNLTKELIIPLFLRIPTTVRALFVPVLIAIILLAWFSLQRFYKAEDVFKYTNLVSLSNKL